MDSKENLTGLAPALVVVVSVQVDSRVKAGELLLAGHLSTRKLSRSCIRACSNSSEVRLGWGVWAIWAPWQI